MPGTGCVAQVFARMRAEGHALCVRSFGRLDSPGTATVAFLAQRGFQVALAICGLAVSAGGLTAMASHYIS